MSSDIFLKDEKKNTFSDHVLFHFFYFFQAIKMSFISVTDGKKDFISCFDKIENSD